MAETVDFDMTGVQPVQGERVDFDTEGVRPVKKVGAIESALRTAGDIAREAVGFFDMGAAGLAQLFGDEKGRDEIFADYQTRQTRMKGVYQPKDDEEFSTGGQFAGGVIGMPMAMTGGMGLQSGIVRTADLQERGATLSEAAKAGAVTAAVRVTLNALPMKAGGTVGRMIENKVGSIVGGAATGGAIAGGSGIGGRALENAALPDGEQYTDLEQPAFDKGAIATDLGLGAAFGALPGVAGAARRVRSAKTSMDFDSVAKEHGFENVGKDEEAGVDNPPDLYRTPNGSVITRDQWESASPRLREGWLKSEPRQEVEEIEAAPAPADVDPRVEEIARLREQATTDVAKKALDAQAKKIESERKAQEDADAQEQGRAELERMAATTVDPDIAASLKAHAEKMAGEPSKKGIEVKEGTVEEAEASPVEERLPEGEVREATEDEWAQAHQLDDRQRSDAVSVRRAMEIDPEAVDRAATEHAEDPQAFRQKIGDILETSNERQQTRASGKEPAAKAVRPVERAGQVGTERQIETRNSDTSRSQPRIEPGQPGGKPDAGIQRPNEERVGVPRPVAEARLQEAGMSRADAKTALGFRDTVPQTVLDTAIAKHRVREDGATVSALEKRLRDKGADVSMRHVPEAEAYTGPHAEERQRAADISGKFGKRIVWVDQGKKPLVNGAVLDSTKDAILLSTHGERPAAAVTGHELTHWMRIDRPDLYGDLVKSLAPHMGDYETFASGLNAKRAMRNLPPLKKEMLQEEFIADVVGNRFNEPAFWAEMAKTDPARFERLARAVIEWITQTIERMKGGRESVDAYVKDLQKTRKVIADSLKKYAEGETSATDGKEERLSISDKSGSDAKENPKRIGSSGLQLPTEFRSTRGLQSRNVATETDVVNKTKSESSPYNDRMPDTPNAPGQLGDAQGADSGKSVAKRQPYSAAEFTPAPEDRIPADLVREANRRGISHAKSGGFESYYTPVLQVAYNLGHEGVDLSAAPIVTGIRYGNAPETGVSYNSADGLSERGLSLAQVAGEKEISSSIWFRDRKAYEYRGVLVGHGSDGEALVLPLHVTNEGDTLRGVNEKAALEKQIAERKSANEPSASVGSDAAIHDPLLSLSAGGKQAQLAEETLADRNVRRFFDRFNRVSGAQKSVEEAKGSKLADSEDMYLADTLYHGRLQHAGEEVEKQYFDPLAKKLKDASKVGLTVRDADDFLMAVHAPERNRVIAARNAKMPDGGSGITNAQAKEIIDSFNPAQRKALDDIAQFVHKMNRDKLDRMVDGGLITADVRDRLNKQYRYYVPLKTLDEEDAARGTGRGYEMRANDITTAMGRASKAGSPIAASMMDFSRALIRTEKARVDKTIWNFAQNEEAHGFMRPYDKNNPPKEVMKRELGPDGQVREVVDPLAVQDKTLSLVVDGQNERVFVADDLLRDQLRKISTTQDVGAALRVIGKATGTVGRLLTEFNPSFTLPNAVRDAGAAFIRARAYKGVNANTVVKNIPSGWKAVVDYKLGKESADGKLYEEFLSHGAKTGAYGITGVTDTLHRLEKAGAEIGYDDQSRGLGKKAWHALGDVADVVSGANEVFEYATRFALYKEARRAGYSADRAAAMAKEITVNFNRAGEYGKMMNSVIVFANAALQGLNGTIQFAKDKKVRGAMLAVVALGAGVQAFNELLGGENDETGELNANLMNDNVQDKNVSLSTGDGAFIKIPIDPSYSFLYAMGRRLWRAGSQGDIAREASGIVGALLDSTLPLRLSDASSVPAKALSAVTPTVVSPFFDVSRNQNFFGNKITPEQHGKVDAPWYTISYPQTSEIAKAASELANKMTGGDSIEPGLSQKTFGEFASPEAIEYLVSQYTGGLGQTVMQSKNAISAAAGGKPVDVNKLPVVGRFVAEDQAKSFINRRYDEIAQAFEYAKNRERKNIAVDQIDPQVRATLPAYDQAESRIKAIKQQMRDAAGREQDLDPYREQIRALKAGVIKRYNEANNERANR